MKLFVYGTLKKGYGNNRLLDGATLVGDAVTHRQYHLYDCGFPKAVPHEAGLPVMGEVWEVNERTLDHCDSLEGHPRWYIRRDVDVTFLRDGNEDTVMIYEMDNYQGSRMCNVHTTKEDNKYYYWGGRK